MVGVADRAGRRVASLLQPNFKRGIAYSTVSQLGYMFAAVGFGAPFAALFHLVTHASFKALLFLTAGVVIHALGGRGGLADLGGLRRICPGADAGVPDRLAGADRRCRCYAGAFSKDVILEAAEKGDVLIRCSGACMFVGVLLTGLYSGRLFFGVFHGPRRFTGHFTCPATSCSGRWCLWRSARSFWAT